MKVEIYTTEGCEWCEDAVDWFLENRIPYQEMVVSYNKRKQISSILTERSRRRVTTFPQIFINDLYIGGYTDLMKKSKLILEQHKEGDNGNKNILKNGLYLLPKS